MTSEAKPRNEKRMRQSCHDGSRTSSANDTHGAFPLYPLEASSKERLSEKHGNSRWHLSGAEVAESHSKSLAYNTNTREHHLIILLDLLTARNDQSLPALQIQTTLKYASIW